jgi:tight adherence protein C
MLWIIIAVVVIILGALLLVGIGMKDSKDVDPLQDRLAEFAARGERVDLEEIEMSQPLTSRIIFPLARKLGELALRFTPQNAIQQTSHKLELAGNLKGIDPTLFWAMRMFGLSLGAILFFVSRIVPEGSFLEGRGLLFAIPAAALGFFMP